MTSRTLSSPRRYLALWFPLLPIDRLERSYDINGSRPKGKLAAKGPLVVVEPVQGALRIRAACRRAMALGLEQGLALADARARVPTLVVVSHDPVADAAFLDRLADVADRITPSVAVEPPDGLTLDVTGCSHLLGGESRMRHGLLVRYARAGIEVHAALGSTPDTARALARFGCRRTAGSEMDTESVLGLPVAALELPDETRLALQRAGLKRIGDLAERPAAMLAARFGTAAATRLRRVLGEEDRRIVPRRSVPPIVAEQTFAEPIGRVEDAEATLALLLSRVATLLAKRDQGGRTFEAAFFRTDGVVRRVRVVTGRSSRDAGSLERLFRDRLDTLADPLDPGFGFDLVRLAVLAVEGLGPYQEALETGQVLPNRVEEALVDLVDRLAARFGREAVTRFVPINTRDPHRAAHVVPAQGTTPMSGWPEPPPGEPPLRPFQVFVPPQSIEAVAVLPDGPPVRFRWRRIFYDVALAEGPERLLPEWWQHGPPNGGRMGRPRDYYRIEDREGRRFWVFRVDASKRTPHPRWFLHGLFA